MKTEQTIKNLGDRKAKRKYITYVSTELFSKSKFSLQNKKGQHSADSIPRQKTVHGSVPCCACHLFFMQFKTLRRRENGSKLSLGRIANSISQRADTAFYSFQYPSVPTAMLANCYQTGLFTDIFHSSSAF